MIDEEPVVIVEVQGGCVSQVFANAEVRVIVRDFDSIGMGDADPVQGKDMEADQAFHSVPLN